MSSYIYVDSSFISPVYAEDVHSAEAERRMSQKPMIWLTRINRAEVAHAIFLQVFRKRISSEHAQFFWNNFEMDCRDGIWTKTDLPERIWDKSIHLARMYGPTLGVRTLDSLHVACALELHAQKFWTFDERQARLAEAVGLDTSA